MAEEIKKKTPKTQAVRVKKKTVNTKKTIVESETMVAKETSSSKTQRKADEHTLTVDVLDTSGKVVGKQELSATVFGVKPNAALIAQAVRVYLVNQRQGTVANKSRGQVRGSTRKIYRQKGTGRARHGGIRAPIFVGGGVTHARQPVNYSMTMPQKMRQKALAGALSAKLQEKDLRVVKGLETLEAKTKVVASALVSLGLRSKEQKTSILVVINDGAQNIVRGARNIEGVRLTSAVRLHTYDVLTAKTVVFSQNAVANIEKRFAKK